MWHKTHSLSPLSLPPLFFSPLPLYLSLNNPLSLTPLSPSPRAVASPLHLQQQTCQQQQQQQHGFVGPGVGHILSYSSPSAASFLSDIIHGCCAAMKWVVSFDGSLPAPKCC